MLKYYACLTIVLNPVTSASSPFSSPVMLSASLDQVNIGAQDAMSDQM